MPSLCLPATYFIKTSDETQSFLLFLFFNLIWWLLLSGGVYGAPGFVGCMRLISIDGNYKLPTDWKEEVNILSLLILGVSVLSVM